MRHIFFQARSRASQAGIVTATLLAVAILSVWIACDDDSTDPDDNDGPPPPSLTDPIWEYSHSQGRAITGGYVYRGSLLPPLVGKYVYADYESRHIWALSYDGTTASNEFLVDAQEGVSSFGVTQNGELLACEHSSMSLTKLRKFSESGGVYSLVDAFPNLSFDQPVDLKHAGDGSNRLFVVEQAGFIRVFLNDPAATTTNVFLDISGPVACCGEEGLLGLAFHPSYESNGFFFVYYTTSGLRRDRLSRFNVSANPNVADPASEKILIELDDREPNHNGGALFFGGDGMLYLGLGDEGSAGDPYENAQDRTVLFGKILRLDVDQNVNTIPYYGIPADNPFVGNTDGYREEIYAWGFRNPWRVTQDAVTGRIWAGDVGQRNYEEIDIIQSGKNYGWDCREGMHDYTGPDDGPSPACPQ
jgi:Glucose / Sorbosone dehydrogenase